MYSFEENVPSQPSFGNHSLGTANSQAGPPVRRRGRPLKTLPQRGSDVDDPTRPTLLIDDSF